MGRGGTDGCSEAARSDRDFNEALRRRQEDEEVVVQADFAGDVSHVRYLYEAYRDYRKAIDIESSRELQDVLERRKPFNYCSNNHVYYTDYRDHFAVIINEASYQLGFDEWLGKELARMEAEESTKRKRSD